MTADVPSTVRFDEPLQTKNWFQTGGCARLYSAPSNEQEFAMVVQWAQAQQLPVYILGEGANVLISDTGFDGLVIRPSLIDLFHTQFDEQHALVHAGTGVSFEHLIEYCLNNNLIGLEEFGGIPGTVGGSVFINIHYFEFLLSQFLVTARVIDRLTGEVTTVDAHWFAFGYNQSRLHDNTHYLVSACFKVKAVDQVTAAYARGRWVEIIRHRRQRYPHSHTCGSFFRNFYAHEVSVESAGKKMIYVAYYLDKLGVKGHLSVGDAIVSYQHANMIVNRGKATTADIIELVRVMQTMVRDEFGITPQPECRLVGFVEYPLLK